MVDSSATTRIGRHALTIGFSWRNDTFYDSKRKKQRGYIRNSDQIPASSSIKSEALGRLRAATKAVPYAEMIAPELVRSGAGTISWRPEPGIILIHGEVALWQSAPSVER
jgi:hypothetical protein